MDGSMFYFHPMGCKSHRFSSFLLKLRKEADDREAPGGCSSLSILPCVFVCIHQTAYQPDCLPKAFPW